MSDPPLRRRLHLLAVTLGVAIATGCGTSPTQVFDSGGTHLVIFSSDRNSAAGQFDLYLYDLDQAGFHLMSGINSTTDNDLNPTMTSDARVVAFERAVPGNGTDILMYDRQFARFITPTKLNTPHDETDPAFSFDASRLAFVRDSAGFKRIRMLQGSPADSLIPLPGLDTLATYNDWAPAPDQTGDKIAFVSDRRGGNLDVYVWKRGQGVLDLPGLRSDSVDTEPSLTPNGRYLCFASNRAGGTGGFDLYLYDLTTLAFVTLPSLNSTGNERAPSISVDGNVLVFESDRSGGRGKIDLYNYDRTTNQIGQGMQESSTGNDRQPYLLWQ